MFRKEMSTMIYCFQALMKPFAHIWCIKKSTFSFEIQYNNYVKCTDINIDFRFNLYDIKLFGVDLNVLPYYRKCRNNRPIVV